MRYVLQVAELGNMRRAAEILHVAQPSLSQQVKAVEREIGASLFRRNARGMVLTKVGEVFVAEAHLALKAFEEAVGVTRRAAAGLSTHLRLAVTQGLGDVLRALLREFFAANADTEVQVVNLPTRELMTALAEYRIGAGLGYLPLLRGEMTAVGYRVVRRTPVRALLPADSDLGRQEQVDLAALATQPLILPPGDEEPCLRHQLLNEFTRRGLTPRLGSNALDHDFAVSLVENGQGYSLSVRGDEFVPPSLVSRPVRERLAPIQIALFWRQDQPAPAAVRLLEAARELDNRLPDDSPALPAASSPAP